MFTTLTESRLRSTVVYGTLAIPRQREDLDGVSHVLLFSSSLFCFTHSSSSSSSGMHFSEAILRYFLLSISALQSTKTITARACESTYVTGGGRAAGLRFLLFEEADAVLVSVYFSYPHWSVSAAVLLVNGSVEGMQQPQHGQSTKLCSKVSWGPSVLRPQTWPGSVLDEDSHSFCVSCKTTTCIIDSKYNCE